MNELIRNHTITKFQNALDIGCSVGVYSKLLQGFGFKNVTGVDVDEPAIIKAKQFFESDNDGSKINFYLKNAEELDCREKFDFILCSEVIEHCSKPDAVIKNIQECMSPGGIAIVSMPNVLSLSYMVSLVGHKVLRKEIDETLRRHTEYPFFRTRSMLCTNDIKLIGDSGYNLLLFDPLINRLDGKPMLEPLNRINTAVSKLGPLKSFSQFYFIVLAKNG